MHTKTSLSHAPVAVQGLLLAGGRGRRFDPSGQTSKLQARLASGASVLRASCERLLPWVDALTIVLGEHNQALSQEVMDLPVQVLVCPEADDGLGATLSWGMRGTTPTLGWIIALADMPYIDPSTYGLVRSRLCSGFGAIRPTFEGEPGHPVGLARQWQSKLVGLSAKHGLGALLQDPDIGLEALAVSDPGCVRDIDYPTDLDRPA
jgi:molybdenum cofactor cytidylyltransferase